MPLIQWIMQNLARPGGVVVSGKAIVEDGSISIGGVVANGSALYEKINNIIASGGALGGGQADLSFINGEKKRVEFLPGETVYDKCNRSYVVISFSFASKEPTYEIGNNIVRKIRYDSQLSPTPDEFYIKQAQIAENNISCIENSPLGNFPQYLGQRSIKEYESPEEKGNVATSRINAIKNSPLENLPVYTGKKRIKV